MVVILIWEYCRNTVGLLGEFYGNTIGNPIGNPVEYCWHFLGILGNKIAFFTGEDAENGLLGMHNGKIYIKCKGEVQTNDQIRIKSDGESSFLKYYQ